jgi:hypothetical protein
MPLRARLGSLVPDAIRRRRTDDDAAFVEAAREAYRAAAQEAAKYLEPGGHVTQRPADPDLVPPAEPADASAAEARAPEGEPDTPPWSWATRRPDEPGSEQPTGSPSTAAVAAVTRSQAREIPLDHLLRVPESVDAAADDFFAGLTRRVEGEP